MTEPEHKPKATFLYTLRAVFWSFFGLRRHRDFATDFKLNPVHIIVAGLLGAACFIGLLLVLVQIAVSK